MQRGTKAQLLTLALATSCTYSHCATSEALSNDTVLETMVSVIAPATDTIWDAYDLKTDEEWNSVDQAAVITGQAFERIKHRYSSEREKNWASDPQWQALSNQVIEATQKVRQAVNRRNEDLLMEAGEQLYAPCESCHILFQPAGETQ